MEILSDSTFEPMCLSRNPIEINVEAFDPDAETRAGIRYYLDLYMPSYYQSNEFEKKSTLEASEQPPYMVSSSRIFPGANFSIEELIDSYLLVKPPSFGQTKISVCPEATVSFYTKWKSKQGAQEEIGTNPMLWALKAGIQEEYFADWKDSFFTDYIGKNRSFLTFEPKTKRVRTDQPTYLYWLSNMSPTPQKITLRVLVAYTDGTKEYFNKANLSGIMAYTVYCIPVGATELGLGELEKEVESYQVWLINENNERLTEIREYIIDYCYVRNVKYVLYQNSLGGFDTLCMTGQTTENIKVERQLFEREQPFGYSATFSERTINTIVGRRELVVNSGWIEKDKLWQYHDLMYTKYIMLVTDREYIPLVITNDSIIKNLDDDNLTSREISFEYSNREESVTPLPPAPVKVERPTSWRPYVFGNCVLDASGRRAGLQIVNVIVKYYIDDGTNVKPLEIKPNTPDTDGYIPPVPTSACALSTTPYLSAAINRVGSFTRNNCPNGQTGSKAIVKIAAQAYGSELSQSDADAKAEAAWKRLNTQDYANNPINGATCSVAPELYAIAGGVPAGKFNYRWFDKSGGDSGGQLYGGPGAYGTSAEVVYGVGWAIQSNINPASVKYPQGSNDCILPCDSGGFDYRMTMGGNLLQKTIKLYYNGELKVTRVVTPAEFQANNYYITVTFPTPIPSSATVYLSVE